MTKMTVYRLAEVKII